VEHRRTIYSLNPRPKLKVGRGRSIRAGNIVRSLGGYDHPTAGWGGDGAGAESSASSLLAVAPCSLSLARGATGGKVQKACKLSAPVHGCFWIRKRCRTLDD
jgi:hypothetical protein